MRCVIAVERNEQQSNREFKMTASDDSASGQPLAERLERIETALAHLQHDIDSLNASLTTHFRRMLEFDERFTRIEEEIHHGSQAGEDRGASTEKPPHY